MTFLACFSGMVLPFVGGLNRQGVVTGRRLWASYPRCPNVREILRHVSSTGSLCALTIEACVWNIVSVVMPTDATTLSRWSNTGPARRSMPCSYFVVRGVAPANDLVQMLP